MVVETHAQPRSRPIVDTVFFAVNFATAIMFFVACVISIAAADNPFALIGGLFMALPVLAYAIAEWLCWYRRRDWIYRPLGFLNLFLAAFLVFGGVTNVGEAVLDDDPADPLFIVIFGLGFGLVAAYLAHCGWRRIRLPSSHIASPGLPRSGG